MGAAPAACRASNGLVVAPYLRGAHIELNEVAELGPRVVEQGAGARVPGHVEHTRPAQLLETGALRIQAVREPAHVVQADLPAAERLPERGGVQFVQLSHPDLHLPP